MRKASLLSHFTDEDKEAQRGWVQSSRKDAEFIWTERISCDVSSNGGILGAGKNQKLSLEDGRRMVGGERKWAGGCPQCTFLYHLSFEAYKYVVCSINK